MSESPVKLNHIRSLTDDTGIYQHAKYSVPNRIHGYCTDDNSRALLAVARHYHIYKDQESRDLINTYISFVFHAQRQDGRFRNFMNFNRQFEDEVSSEDCFGRVVWALGYILHNDLPEEIQSLSWHVLEKAIWWVPRLRSARGHAYTLLGLAYLMRSEWAMESVVDMAKESIDFLLINYRREAGEGWRWYEPVITYSNGILPYAMIKAGAATGRKDAVAVGRETLRFLTEVLMPDGIMAPVGCHGWYPRGGTKAAFDHQPVDVKAAILAWCEAWDHLQEESFREAAERGFQWFTGKNEYSAVMYDPMTGGGYDGLTPDGPNLNQGAEATISLALSALAMRETFGEDFRLPDQSDRVSS